MAFTLLYWHWLAFGMVLVLAEIFVPSFTIFWFGLGACVVALALLLFPGMALAGQLFLWAVASCLFTFLWFRYFKPHMVDRTKAGVAREAALGESGQVVRAPAEGRRGVVRFTTPLLGADEWEFLCEEPVEVGERVVVRDISGNTLVVARRDGRQQ